MARSRGLDERLAVDDADVDVAGLTDRLDIVILRVHTWAGSIERQPPPSGVSERAAYGGQQVLACGCSR